MNWNKGHLVKIGASLVRHPHMQCSHQLGSARLEPTAVPDYSMISLNKRHIASKVSLIFIVFSGCFRPERSDSLMRMSLSVKKFETRQPLNISSKFSQHFCYAFGMNTQSKILQDHSMVPEQRFSRNPGGFCSGQKFKIVPQSVNNLTCLFELRLPHKHLGAEGTALSHTKERCRGETQKNELEQKCLHQR